MNDVNSVNDVNDVNSVNEVNGVRSERDKETKETKETKEKRGINKPSWRGIATDDLADTADHPCNSVAIYLCVTALLIHNVIPSATRDLLPDGTP